MSTDHDVAEALPARANPRQFRAEVDAIKEAIRTSGYVDTPRGRLDVPVKLRTSSSALGGSC